MIADTIKKVLVLAALALALTGCENMHQKHSQVAEARWSRARAAVMQQLAEQQFANGQLDKALVTVGKALELDPAYPNLQVLRGRILAEKGQGQRAVASFELAIAMNVQAHQAHYHLGVQLEKYGQFEKALAHYGKAHEINPGSVPYGIATAEMLGRLERVGEALQLIDGMLASNEQSAALRMTGGELCMSAGQTARALGYYRDAARMAPDDVQIQRAYAVGLYRGNHYDQARPLLERLLDRGPGGQSPLAAADGEQEQELVARGELLTALGDCYLAAGRYGDAADCFQDVVSKYPRQAGAWENLAKVALHQSRWGDAQSAAERAVALAPASHNAHLLRGFAMSNQGYLSEAASSFATAHQLRPGDVLPLCLLSDSYRRLGDYRSARQAVERALKIAPNDKLAGHMLHELANAEFEKSPATAGVRVEQ